MHHRSLAAVATLLSLSLVLAASARAGQRACPANDATGAGCVEACELRAGPDVRASDLFAAKLRSVARPGTHLGVNPGAPPVTAVSAFRVASLPLKKDAAARWRQNGLWAGPCAGLAAVFQARVINDKDANNVVDLYELRYTSEATARRSAALLETSWDWNGHPFIAVQRGPNVIVAEGRYGALSALESVGAHFGGIIYPRRAPLALPLCDKAAANKPPLFEGDGLAVHVLGFAPSGELAWLEATAGQGGATTWTLHVNNLVNDREVAVRTYRTARPGADAFCAQHRAAAGALLSERAVSVGAFTAFDKPVIDGAPLTVLIQPTPPSGNQVVMQGPAGTKVLGRLRAAAGTAKPLGFIRSPFEERVAVFVSIKHAATGRAGLRVFGARLDKRWLAQR
jgi:hypothetical protein